MRLINENDSQFIVSEDDLYWFSTLIHTYGHRSPVLLPVRVRLHLCPSMVASEYAAALEAALAEIADESQRAFTQRFIDFCREGGFRIEL